MERLASDGGTILELLPTADGHVAGPEIPGRVQFYYVNGTGIRVKEFGKVAVSLASFIGSSGSASPLTTKGDLWGFSTVDARFPVGANNSVVIADSAQTLGVKWGVITEGLLSTSDITTGNVSTSKHGWAPKLPNDATKYLDGTGNYTVPAGSGGGWGLTGNTLGADKILGGVDASGGYAVKCLVENQEIMRWIDDGDNLQWTGPRIKIGHTGAAFYPNADIISIKKNLGDQLTVTMQNTHSDVAFPSGSTFVLINDDGTKTGGINILNSDWPSGGQDGVFPGEYACLAFGGPAVYGSQTAQDVRFIANEAQWAFFDQSAGDFIIDGGNLKVTNGVINAKNVGAQLIIGNTTETFSSAGGAVKFGKTGLYSFIFDDSGTTAGVTIKSGTDRWATLDLLSAAASGHANAGVWTRLINADGRTLWLTVPESGIGDSYLAKPNYATIATSASAGIRCNVNAVNNSGWEIDANGYMKINAARFALFGATPVAQQAMGATFTNNVTAGGTGDTANDIVAASVDTSAASLTSVQNCCYQMARTIRQLTVGVRAYAMFS